MDGAIFVGEVVTEAVGGDEDDIGLLLLFLAVGAVGNDFLGGVVLLGGDGRGGTSEGKEQVKAHCVCLGQTYEKPVSNRVAYP